MRRNGDERLAHIVTWRQVDPGDVILFRDGTFVRVKAITGITGISSELTEVMLDNGRLLVRDKDSYVPVISESEPEEQT